jgi:ADP-ribose pyrophosphatase YjhB (NUDIX family)
MLIAPNEAGTHHAVSSNAPSAENPGGFHRLIGGSVEFGETHRHAIIREVDEELGAAIRELTHLGMVENIFRFNGTLGHEIVALYTGRLVPEPAESGATLTESDGAVVPVVWRPFDDAAQAVPLYPAGASEWISRRPRP